MKIRNGFVSNSSSSSFICSSTLSIKKVEDKLKTILKLYNELYDKDLKFAKVFQKPFIITKDKKSKEYKDFISGWIFGERNQYLIVKTEKDLDGKLIINSTDDNSIPWQLFELISDFFNGDRVHLG